LTPDEALNNPFPPLHLQYLSMMIEEFGMHGTMLMFSMVSLAGGFFVLRFLPETKGKSYEEISALMR
jgi:Sugar (and other) transporter